MAAVQSNASAAAPQVAAGQALRIVTFRIADRHFGVDVSTVREIRGWQPTTPLPNAAPHVLGVVNLRGIVLPVHDLRQRIGLGPTAVGPSSVVIVIAIGEQLAGILVDAVSDIVDVPDSQLRPAPEMGGQDSQILGLVVRGESVIVLPDLPAMVKDASGGFDLGDVTLFH
jgi:purine-binding chemotaxis protein CheW